MGFLERSCRFVTQSNGSKLFLRQLKRNKNLINPNYFIRESKNSSKTFFFKQFFQENLSDKFDFTKSLNVKIIKIESSLKP